jgi:hypothetical protein
MLSKIFCKLTKQNERLVEIRKMKFVEKYLHLSGKGMKIFFFLRNRDCKMYKFLKTLLTFLELLFYFYSSTVIFLNVESHKRF